jgi:hypothetical protein
MKRSHVVFALLLLHFLPSLVSPAGSQEALYSQREGESLYYEPEHFVWLQAKDQGLQQEDLLPVLSRQRVVIVLEQPVAQQSRNVQTFLENPPTAFPAIDTFQVLPSSQTDVSFTVGYIQDDALQRRVKASHAFEMYLVTFKDVLRMATLLRVLDALAKTPGVDFVLPVFVFPDKLVAPFVQFEVEFLPLELIPGGVEQIKQLNRMSFVKETEQTSNFKEPVVLQLQKDAPTNILATVLRYQYLSWMVKRAKLRWVRVRMPIEVQSRWELPLGMPSFSIWEPMRYLLSIERDQDVELLPNAFTESAVHAWLSDNTHLPDELMRVDGIERTAQRFEDGRVLEEVSFTVRLSKTGTYLFSPYPVQAAYPALDEHRRIEVFQDTRPSFLTIPGHLPRKVQQIPGHLITVPERSAPTWIAPTAMILGTVCMVLGLGWTVRIARGAWGLPLAGRERLPEVLEPPLATLRGQYQDRLQEVRRQLGALSFHEDMEAQRAWLRSLSVLVKRLLGERYGQDETLFLGGLGVSSASIQRYVLASSLHPNGEPLATALAVLQALDRQALRPAVSLSKDAAKLLLAQVETLIDGICR